MTDDREPFEAARRAGKALHQEQRLARADLAVIREALEHLPATCRYHGDNLDREARWGGGACCDTGKPSLARRNAEDGLRRLARD